METTYFSIAVYIIATLFIYLFYKIGYNNGYEQGQIDAINNKIKYKLIEFEDGIREYIKDDEIKDLQVKYTIIN